MRAREAPDVLAVGVAAVLLRGVAGKRGRLALEVAPVERDVGLEGEVEVVPGDLITEDRRPLEGPQTLGRDDLVILVHVAEAGLEDGVRAPLLPEVDQELEDVLPALGKGTHLEVVHGQVRLRDAELCGRLPHLARERVGRKALGQRLRGDREGDVAHLRAGLDEARHRATAAELAVVGVRSEHERALESLDHARAAVGTRGV